MRPARCTGLTRLTSWCDAESEMDKSVGDRADRLPPISEPAMTPAQLDAVRLISSGPRGGVMGPFVPLLRSPELMTRMQRVGEYLRFGGELQNRVLEFTILIIARLWNQQFEWRFHVPLAMRSGLSTEVISAIALQIEPPQMDPVLGAVWSALEQLEQRRPVDDETYEQLLRSVGEAGTVEVIAVAGYYTSLAMLMNLGQTKPPPIPNDDPELAGLYETFDQFTAEVTHTVRRNRQ